MSRRIALVTGASSGIGMLTATCLAKEGFFVLATMRKISRAKNLLDCSKKYKVENDIRCPELDVTKEASIESLKRELSSYNQLDILVNNAGIAVGGFSEELTINDYKKQFDTNFFGVIAVTNTVLPLMRERGQGKIINISSISGKFGFPALSPYTASKHALEGYSESLRLELKPFGIDVVLIEPGSFSTNIWTTGNHTVSSPKGSPYFFYMKKIEEELRKGMASHEDPLKVAQLIAKISLTKNPKLRYKIGKGVKTAIFLKKVLPWTYFEKMVIKKLFRIIS
ncbi:SDR family oxidoreductase [Metabacillus arenae]|uniref:SDR family oxidoreductase n=1 Tax=Metabacillus arenae TaxID=2771434 RepID=A0A926RY23_9BACI|nr:SDR family oxidoreductase [Metabacillus arenae]MBD1380747.1 SDR family oxidoreductase [Metabacillus arenae]